LIDVVPSASVISAACGLLMTRSRLKVPAAAMASSSDWRAARRSWVYMGLPVGGL
jgi:hypothetical protein